MSINIYSSEVLDTFKKKSLYFNQNSTHYIIRCPYCGDSRKRINTGHLYIRKDIPVFRCNRCNYGSNIFRLIRDLTGITPEDKKLLFREDVNLDQLIQYQTNNHRVNLNSMAPIKLNYKSISEDHNDPQYKHKLIYLLHRFNTNRFIGDINIANKIIFDVKHLFNENPKLWKILLNKYSQEKADWIVDNLQNKFIGFLGYLNNIIIFRSVDKLSDWRYYKIKIDEHSPDYFIIDRLLDVIEDIPNLIVTEGPFDILVPYFKFDNINQSGNFQNLVSRLYIAAGSKQFIQAIKFMSIIKTIFKFNVYILSDNDVNISYYNKVYKSCKNIINKMEIITNLKKNDFGEWSIQPTVSKRF